MTDCGCSNFPASLGNVTFGASVGIGTSAPSKPLEVAGGAAKLDAGVVFGSGSQGGAPGIHADGTNLYVEANNGALYFRPAGEGNNANMLALSAGGKLSIGGTGVGNQLEIDNPGLTGGNIWGLTAGDNGLGGPQAFLYRSLPGSGKGLGGGSNEVALSAYNDGTTRQIHVTRPDGGALLTVDNNNGDASLSNGTGTIVLSPNNVQPASTPSLRITDSSYEGLAISGSPLRLNWDAPSGSPIYLTNGAGHIALTVSATGFIGVGTTGPIHALDVLGTISASASIEVTGRTVADGNGCYYA